MPQDNHSKLDAIRQDLGATLNPNKGREYPVQPIVFKSPLQVFNASYWNDTVECVATAIGIGPRGYVEASLVFDGMQIETRVQGVHLSGYTELGHVLWLDLDEEDFEEEKEDILSDEPDLDVRLFSVEAVNAWFASLVDEWVPFDDELLHALHHEAEVNPQ